MLLHRIRIHRARTHAHHRARRPATGHDTAVDDGADDGADGLRHFLETGAQRLADGGEDRLHFGVGGGAVGREEEACGKGEGWVSSAGRDGGIRGKGGGKLPLSAEGCSGAVAPSFVSGGGASVLVCSEVSGLLSASAMMEYLRMGWCCDVDVDVNVSVRDSISGR